MSVRIAFVCVAAISALQSQVGMAAEPPVRPSAVLDLNFDEAEGAAQDRATPGAKKDAAEPINNPRRSQSPFWNVRNGLAAQFDANQKQFFQIADSPDLDQAAGCTLSFYVLNLLDPADAAFHGVIAKRSATEQKTNYGFNYQPSSKKLQAYIHDESTFKVVGFPLDAALPYRRLVHLSATFRPGDAPDSDADADFDDLEIKLYVNGKAIKPQDSTGGPVLEDAGWITDVNYSGLLSDAPLTIGASYPNGELFSGLIDEFQLFNRPRSSDEALRLFREVAGENGEELARLETETPATPAPIISSLTPRGVQIGSTTRVTITGQNLSPNPSLTLLGEPFSNSAIVEATNDRIVADISIPADRLPTLLPLAIRTDNGVSPPIPLPADRLPQRLLSDVSEGQPAEQPAAYTGTLNGSDQPRLLIEGRQGQTFVAEVELKRLGGTADPVLELKTTNDSPIEVAWGHTQRGGDARLVATLPQDGRYVIELHDLAYKAPASQFRLLVGELHLVDAVIPPSIEPGSTEQAKAIGIGLADPTMQVTASAGETAPAVSGPAVALSQGIMPPVRISDGRELTEAEATAAPIDLAAAGLRPTYITGQLAEAAETDRFVLQSVAGQPITLEVLAKSIGSPVEPDLVVLQKGKRLGRKAARPGEGTARLEVTPAEGEITVEVSDRLRGHGPERFYRLQVVPTSAPDFSATILGESVVLPKTGRGVARLHLERRGDVGEVRLTADPASGVVVEPAVLPKGSGDQDVFITIKAAGDRPIGPVLRLSAQSDTAAGPMQRQVQASPGGSLAGFDAGRRYYEVPIVVAASAPTVEIVRLPAAALKGVTDSVGLQLTGEIPERHVVRFTLLTDEPARPNDPKNPAAGNKPVVRLAPDATLEGGMSDAVIPLEVPVDLAIAQLGAVIKAEVVPHAWSNHVVAVGYSAPFQLPVKEAATIAGTPSATKLKPGENEVPITFERAAGFTQPVRIELRGLANGYAATPADVPADASQTTLKVTVPAGAAAGPLKDVELVILGTNGTVLKSVKPFGLEVQP
jgi:hypothetical protein